MSTNKQIKLGALMSYVSIIINVLTGLLYTPWMIRSIGRENFGLYTLAMSVISLFVFDFGLSAAVTRFISKYLAEGRQDRADKCLGLVYRLYIAIDIVFLLLLAGVYFFIPQIYKELTPTEIESFKIVYVMVAIYSILSFPFIPANGVLIAHERFVDLRICDIFHKLFIVVAMAICLLMGGGLYALVIVNVISGLLTIALKLYCISNKTNQKIEYRYYNKDEFRSIVGFSGWVTVKSLAQRCIFNLAPSILGALSGSVEIAILGIATTLEGYTFTFANALSGLFLPKVTRILSKEGGDVLPLMIKVGRIQIFVISLIVFGVVCFGSNFIHLWVGPEFNRSYICAILIIIPSLFHLPQEIGTQTILAMNKVKLQAQVYLIMAITNLVMTAILAPALGAVGVCISVCVAYMVRTIGMDVIFYTKMNINILDFFKRTYLKLLPQLVAILAIGLLIDHLCPTTGWVGLIIKCSIFFVVYCILMYFSTNQYERTLLSEILSKIKR